jgi:dynein heavy chain
LYITDNNIIDEIFLEDINNILNNGEVPNLMQAEDLEEIYSEIRILANELGIFENKENMNRLFIAQTR